MFIEQRHIETKKFQNLLYYKYEYWNTMHFPSRIRFSAAIFFRVPFECPNEYLFIIQLEYYIISRCSVANDDKATKQNPGVTKQRPVDWSPGSLVSTGECCRGCLLGFLLVNNGFSGSYISFFHSKWMGFLKRFRSKMFYF